MDKQPTPAKHRFSDTLKQPDASLQREIMRQWQATDNGMEGERSALPAMSDDPVANKLLDAAGDAMNRGDWQQGVNILRLVVRDYRSSQEAACARRVIDRLARGSESHGR